MNSISLQATLASAPEKRYSADGTPRTSVLVRFPAPRPEEPDFQIRVVAFGALADELHQNFAPGDPLLVEGRLQVEKRSKPVASTREELNHKETVTELIARRVHPLLPACRPLDDRDSAQQVEAVVAVPQGAEALQVAAGPQVAAVSQVEVVPEVAAGLALPEQTPQPQPAVDENPPAAQIAAPIAGGPKRRRTSTPTSTS
jgi:single-stranded DNA-binding protein